MRIGRWMAVTAAALAACGGAKDAGGGAARGETAAQTAPSAQPDTSPGAVLYGRACVMCHGEAGAGTAIGPALNDHPREVAAVAEAVRNGAHPTKPLYTLMPARGDGTFTDAQIQTVAEYVRSLAK